LLTDTCETAAVARAVAGTLADISVDDSNVVGTAVPPNSTCDVLMKFVPMTVTLVFGLPAAVIEGEIEVRVGTGFGVVP
jgi:hypothetical protein